MTRNHLSIITNLTVAQIAQIEAVGGALDPNSIADDVLIHAKASTKAECWAIRNAIVGLVFEWQKVPMNHKVRGRNVWRTRFGMTRQHRGWVDGYGAGVEFNNA